MTPEGALLGLFLLAVPLFTSLVIFGWLLGAGYLPFTDSCFEHQSERVTCQAVRLWSHPSRGSRLLASKPCTSGNLPPSEWALKGEEAQPGPEFRNLRNEGWKKKK